MRKAIHDENASPMSSAYVHALGRQTVQQLKEQVRVNLAPAVTALSTAHGLYLYLYCANRSEPRLLNLWKFFVDVAPKMRLRLRLLTCRPTATCKQGVTTVHIEA